MQHRRQVPGSSRCMQLCWSAHHSESKLEDVVHGQQARQCYVFVGQWTVDMFAMFHLGRPNIFPLGDLAVRKGLIDLYKLKVICRFTQSCACL